MFLDINFSIFHVSKAYTVFVFRSRKGILREDKPLSLVCANRNQTVTTWSHSFTSETFRVVVALKIKTNVGRVGDGGDWEAATIVRLHMVAETQ